MGDEQAVQRPSFASASRRDEDDGARRCAENGCRHTAKRPPSEICPNLWAHHDHCGVAFAGLSDDCCRSRTGSVFEYQARQFFARDFHAFDECGRR
jgi:hypothetical protein